jgi:hypothetical protein
LTLFVKTAPVLFFTLNKKPYVIFVDSIKISFRFLIGGDGKIYEGRGWDMSGAHAPNYNSRSVGICLIGDFMSKYLEM